MIKISFDFNEELFEEIRQIWLERGIANPARGDDYHSVKKTLDHGAKMITAIKDGKVVGTVWVTHDYRRTYIHHMAVLKAYQGHGIGSLLLQNSLDFSKSIGLQAKLEVYESNIRAKRMYENFGFESLDGYIVQINRKINK